MPRVLVIKDESRILRSLEKGLRAAGFDIEVAATGGDGSRLATSHSFDCIVLDWMLPGRDGLQVLSDLRNIGRDVPVLMLTARDSVEDQVLGLDSGAEDYLLKPFTFAELLARLRVLLRRGRNDRAATLRAGELELDLLRRHGHRHPAGTPSPSLRPVLSRGQVSQSRTGRDRTRTEHREGHRGSSEGTD